MHPLRDLPPAALRWEGTIPGVGVQPGLSYWIEAVDEAGRQALLPADGSGLDVVVTDDGQPPVVTHTPITSALAGEPLTLKAQVEDGSGVCWVRLRYRSITQYHDFRALPMTPAAEEKVYTATVPAAHLDPRWDFMYFIEAMDNSGNGAIYPDLDVETPYVITELVRH
jgi:hypothetical protein